MSVACCRQAVQVAWIEGEGFEFKTRGMHMQLVAVVSASEASHTSKHSVLQQVSKMLTITQVLYIWAI